MIHRNSKSPQLIRTFVNILDNLTSGLETHLSLDSPLRIVTRVLVIIYNIDIFIFKCLFHYVAFHIKKIL